MNVIGIDPGINGAVAVIGDKVEAYDIPVIDIGVGKKVKKTIDEYALRALLYEIVGPEDTIIIEKVNAMPKQGSVSTFRFGEASGFIKGLVCGLGLSYKLVTPQAWKKKMLAGQPKGKDVSRLVASRIFPEVDLRLKKDHNKADALLIATYGHKFI